jgi:PAS domain S-box-containing protein
MAPTEKPRGGTVASPASSVTPEALGIGFAWVIVELAPDGILISDDRGRILMANRHVEELFGYDRDTLVGAQVEGLLPARSRRAHETHRADYAAAPTMRPMGVGLDLFGCHADGSEFPVEISLSRVATDQGAATVVVIRDVTQQRASERAARATLTLDEDERIAAELNDGVIQHIFASALTLASVLSRNRLEDVIAGQLHVVIDELDAGVREIRNTIFARLRP